MQEITNTMRDMQEDEANETPQDEARESPSKERAEQKTFVEMHGHKFAKFAGKGRQAAQHNALVRG